MANIKLFRFVFGGEARGATLCFQLIVVCLVYPVRVWSWHKPLTRSFLSPLVFLHPVCS